MAYSNVLNVSGWCKYIYIVSQLMSSTANSSEGLHVCLIAALLRGERHVPYSGIQGWHRMTAAASGCLLPPPPQLPRLPLLCTSRPAGRSWLATACWTRQLRPPAPALAWARHRAAHQAGAVRHRLAAGRPSATARRRIMARRLQLAASRQPPAAEPLPAPFYPQAAARLQLPAAAAQPPAPAHHRPALAPPLHLLQAPPAQLRRQTAACGCGG